jgi:hypothetical protein
MFYKCDAIAAKPMIQPEYLDRISGPIFRRFSIAEHADALCHGEVYLGTLSRCRAYENAEQGDRQEALHTYQSGTIGTGHPDFEITMQRMGFSDAGDNVVLIQCESTRMIKDGWVLCCSELPNVKAFGAHCVRIDKPRRFFDRLNARLNILIAPGTIYQAQLGLIRYGARNFLGAESEPGPLGFVKPEHEYAQQREVRMLWKVVEAMRPKANVVSVSSVRHLCTRIS